MALPTIFNNIPSGTQEPGANLDACLNALGLMGVTYCTATGTNAVTLTPLASPGQPAVTNPPANLQRFGFAAAATSTGNMTVQVGSGSFFNLYLPGGTVQATTNNVLQKAYYDIVFLSALNSGTGGYMMVGAQAGAITVPRGQLGGMTLSNDGTTPTSVLDISAGQAADSTNTVIINLPVFTKSTAGSWVVGTGNNGMGTGLTIANTTWYHVFAIINAGLADVYFDTSVTAANAPAGTTAFRRLGSFLTTNPANIIAFVQNGDEFIWKTSVYDIQAVTLPTANRTLYTLSGVPTGVQVEALLRATVGNAGAIAQTTFTSPDETDQAVSAAGVGVDLVQPIAGGGNVSGRFTVRTNTSAQIGARASVANTTLQASTYGWLDTRGRLN